MKGAGYDEEIERRIEERTDVPAVATAASIKRAFDALDLRSLAIATPYIRDLNEHEEEFLGEAGYDVVDIDFEIIEQLEADLDKPVVTSNQATLWDALRTIGVDADLPPRSPVRALIPGMVPSREPETRWSRCERGVDGNVRDRTRIHRPRGAVWACLGAIELPPDPYG